MGKRKLAVTGSAYDSDTVVNRYSNDGVFAHVRGWDVGVKVDAFMLSSGNIKFEICCTGGSNEPSKQRPLLEFTAAPNGDVVNTTVYVRD